MNSELCKLLTCIAIIVAAAMMRTGESTSTPSNKASEAEATLINTTDICPEVKGYAGPVPLLITVKDGKIENIEALPNSETPDFFEQAEKILDKWKGKTPQEAMSLKVDGVSGATLSSNAIIANVRSGLSTIAKSNASEATDSTEDTGNIIALITASLIVLSGAIIPLFTRNKRYRLVQLILNVAVLGIWCGTFLSWSSLIGLVRNGISLWQDLVPLLMVIIAFIYPLAGKKQHYCTHICPFGSLQELAGKACTYKLSLSPKVAKMLDKFRQILFAVLLFMMFCGITAEWMNYEFFIAFIWQSAPWIVTLLASITIVLSAFINKPYCRFICPTGTLLKCLSIACLSIFTLSSHASETTMTSTGSPQKVIQGAKHKITRKPPQYKLTKIVFNDSALISKEGYSHYDVEIEIPNGNDAVCDSIRRYICRGFNVENTTDILASCRESAKSYWDEYRSIAEENDGEVGFPWYQEHTITIDTITHDYITLLFTGYNYLGGAHGMPWSYGVTFRRSDGHAMVWEDFTDKAEALRPYITAEMDEEIVTESANYRNESLDTPLPLPDQPPYLHGNSLVFTYRAYEIGYYAMGMPTSIVPLRKIRHLLKLKK